MKQGNGNSTNRPPDDPDSFSSQIQRSEIQAKLIKLVQRKYIPPADREDVVSEIIAEAIRSQAAYNSRRAPFSSWIMAIGKNVIASYYRKRNAEKNNPTSGLISLHAASAQDDKAWEPTDTRAESDCRSSEIVEHFINTAGLSEKERKIIEFGLDKGVKATSGKFSSSTAPRAVEKLKQIASDEKFRERPRGPDPSECAYSNIPPAEHDTALFYDAMRRTPWFVEEIARWRNSPEWKCVKAFLDDERAAKRFPLAIRREHWPELLFRYRQAAHERDPLLRRRFEAAVDIVVAFPEWPKMGYCQLKPNDRLHRLEQFGWPFGPEPFWEIDEQTFEFFVDAADEKRLPIVSLPRFLEFVNQAPISGSHNHSSTHLIRIDWRYPLKTIVESFKKWASKQPKGSQERIAQSGRSRTTRLVGFACIRLMDDFGLNKAEAMSWLKQRFGAPIPSTPERLERAVRATRDALKDFLPSPAEIGV